LLVPALDIVLDGVTRRLHLDVAPEVGLVVEVRDVSWDEVLGADELFLTSTNQLVLPVASIDDQTFTAPGPRSEALAAAVGQVLAGDHPLSDRWLTPLGSVGGADRPS
jgi:branched-subunit amino acid aminotransferase/4-amino-4-deoxychorismate lyase